MRSLVEVSSNHEYLRERCQGGSGSVNFEVLFHCPEGALELSHCDYTTRHLRQIVGSDGTWYIDPHVCAPSYVREHTFRKNLCLRLL
ncbi:hypothetical protein BD311DRAFT_167420 [Dichomitus squalens]|uniref:Uncharacterized protein n=1 Tax=Dichomitus squalens TaxID=114155 RepID=A0A4Q9M598_9APHY|nr:hypothetical protein BD311DRAFT_167420 [Dichomitus squalens]